MPAMVHPSDRPAHRRLASIDIIRGGVMVLMAIDHVRVLLAIVVSVVTLGAVSPWLFANHPMGNPPAPDGYTWSLGLLYLVWVAAVVLLYVPCRWFADLKGRRK